MDGLMREINRKTVQLKWRRMKIFLDKASTCFGNMLWIGNYKKPYLLLFKPFIK